MKHSNIAIFVPHNGCPHQCSFCNQKSITGKSYQPKKADIKKDLEIAIKTLGENVINGEIAFFGGSFTAIDYDYMIELLECAYEYVKDYNFAGIRISTRPDCIDENILNILKKYGVTSIELGAQSMINDVLIANKRGHNVEDVIKASELIKSYGFSLGLQMMTGLYKSDNEKDILTAEKLADLKPDTIRIYPTIVMKNTYLEELYNSFLYSPTELDNTVLLCAKLIEYFENLNIKVIRVGLHSSESMQTDKVAGAYHQAFRELCQSEILLNKILKIIYIKNIQKGNINIVVNPRDVSKLNGQKKCNIEKIKELGYNPIVIQDDKIDINKIEVY